MFVKPGPRPDDAGKLLRVRDPHNRRVLLPDAGREVPDTAAWYRLLLCGDVVLVEREKVGELIADGQEHGAALGHESDPPAALAERAAP
jgi:hypothetical protein